MELAICTCTQASSQVLAEGFRRRGCWSVQQRNARLTLPASPAAAPGTSPPCARLSCFSKPLLDLEQSLAHGRCPSVLAVEAARDSCEDSIRKRIRADAASGTHHGLLDAR